MRYELSSGERQPARLAVANRTPSVTSRLLSANEKGCSNAAFTMLNSPVAAAIPTARETIVVAAKPGLRRKVRGANRRSTARMSVTKFPQRRGRADFTTPGDQLAMKSTKGACGESRSDTGVATGLTRFRVACRRTGLGLKAEPLAQIARLRHPDLLEIDDGLLLLCLFLNGDDPTDLERWRAVVSFDPDNMALPRDSPLKGRTVVEGHHNTAYSVA
jgi:hypothetical protein